MAAACELFNSGGVQATTVDAIMAAAGVARNTFYRYFPSKELLVLAFLERADAEWRSWFTAAVEQFAPSPATRLLGVFEVVVPWFLSPTFRGSPIANVAAEAGDRDDRVAELAAAHRRFVHTFLAGLATQGRLRRPAELASELQILLDGAVVGAQSQTGATARRAVAAHAARAAAAVIGHHTPPGE